MYSLYGVSLLPEYRISYNMLPGSWCVVSVSGAPRGSFRPAPGQFLGPASSVYYWAPLSSSSLWRYCCWRWEQHTAVCENKLYFSSFTMKKFHQISNFCQCLTSFFLTKGSWKISTLIYSKKTLDENFLSKKFLLRQKFLRSDLIPIF